ncbi:hypothetical protein STREPTOSP366_34500 [Streptomyces variabilis]
MTSSRRWACSTRRGCEERFRVTSSARPPGARGGGAGAWSTAGRPCGAPPPGLRVPVRPGTGAVRAAPVHTRTMWCGQDPSACARRARPPGYGCGAPRGAQPQRPTAAHTRPMWWGRTPPPAFRVPGVRVRCVRYAQAVRRDPRSPSGRLRPTRAPCAADGPPPPAIRAPGYGTRRPCAAIRAAPAGGSGPHAHHVQRRLPHAWGAVSLLGVRRAVGAGAGPRVPRAAAAAAPGCARCAATAPSPSSGGHRQRPSFPWTPVRAPRWAQAGRRRARHAPRAAAAPGPGACRQRRGEGGAVLGRCAPASARVSASRRAGGGSTRR